MSKRAELSNNVVDRNNLVVYNNLVDYNSSVLSNLKEKSMVELQMLNSKEKLTCPNTFGSSNEIINSVKDIFDGTTIRH
jgi:hypothetical protein